jgi:hypothetical protein
MSLNEKFDLNFRIEWFESLKNYKNKKMPYAISND